MLLCKNHVFNDYEQVCPYCEIAILKKALDLSCKYICHELPESNERRQMENIKYFITQAKREVEG